MHVKEKSCNSPEVLQLYQKETPTQVLSCEYSKSFRDNFFTELFFELSFSIRKELKKKKVSEEIAFALTHFSPVSHF